MSKIGPIPSDPSAHLVQEVLIEIDGSWALAASGDYETFAVEVQHTDGSTERCVALTFPSRLNKTDEFVTIRLLLSPEDADGLVESLDQTVTWLDSLKQLEN